MQRNGNDCLHAVPFSLEHTRTVALINTTIIPPPDRVTHINAAQGRSVPIFGRRDRIALLT